MTTRHLAILFAVLLGGMSIVFALPQQLNFQPLGIERELPLSVGDWWGTDLAVTDKERVVLGPGTEFARKSYTNGRGDEIQVSIVISGQDMNTSIHRPERCLPAQGWTVNNKSGRIVTWPEHALPSTRLFNVRNVALPDEPPRPIYNLTYYWFVGNTDVTGSHVERTFIDIRDRLLKGYNQRWAYITVASTITKDLKRFGRDERETDALLNEFIKQLVPQIQKQNVERGV